MPRYNYSMQRWTLCAIPIFLLSVFVLASPMDAHAEIEQNPSFAASPYELIAAVNALRAAYGLPAYNVSAILMTTAQNQADYMSATGSVSHTGAGGSSVTDRLLSAGYPLAGQLSLGGFLSENITAGGENMSAQAAVDQWSGDSVHLTTMISPDLTEIGSGISVNNGRAYFVIDCARPINSGTAQVVGTSIVGEFTLPVEGAGIMIPVEISTPNADGDLIHEVKVGQTLWQIAISYNTRIEEIKRLNGLSGDDIYPGIKLLIRKGVLLTPTLQPAAPSNVTSLPASPTRAVATSTSLPSGTVPHSPNRILGSVLGVLAIAFLGGWLFAFLGSSKK